MSQNWCSYKEFVGGDVVFFVEQAATKTMRRDWLAAFPIRVKEVDIRRHGRNDIRREGCPER